MLQTPPEFAPRHGIRDTNDAEGQPALYFVCQHSKLLVDCHTGALPTPLLAMQLAQASAPLLSIGEWREHHCLATWMHSDDPAPAGYAFVGLRTLLMESTMEAALLGIASRAIQIAEWARTHQFCGVCATPMQLLAGERAMRCPGCGMTAYPRISPAMMVLIKQGNAVLLARHTASPTGRFTPLAGFLEAGESIEEAIHREVMEETGWRIAVTRQIGAFRRFTYMPEYDLWAEKLCTVYLARPIRRLGPPTEAGHRAVWLPVEEAPALLGNPGDRGMLARFLAK